jgi:hypothetical protein
MEAATAALQATRAAPSTATQAIATATKAAPAANGAAAPTTEVTQGPDALRDPKAADESKEGAAVSDEDESTLPFNNHPRWQKLKREHAEAAKQVQALQPRAEQYDKITAYMDQYDLSAEDVAIGYDIIAKMRTNPILAYQALAPIWQELCRRVGVTLPDDLVQRIKDGFIDEKSARELAQARARAAVSQEEVKRSGERLAHNDQQRTVQAIHSSVAAWDTQQLAKNPDYTRLRPFVENEARAIMAREGKAKTPDAALAVLERALKATMDRLAPFRPTNGHVPTPKTPNAATPSTAIAPSEPKSLREAATQGLAGTYRFNS